MALAVFVEPVRTSRTFEAVIENLLEGIERARLRTDDRLPNEQELAGQLGISKPTLRQALRVLERSGLLRVRAGKGGGIFMAAEVIPVDAISQNVAVEEEEAVDVLLGRRLLEGSATVLAALRGTEEDFAGIERTVDLMRRNLGDRPRVMGANAMFHRAVVRASHNKTLQSAMRHTESELAPIRDSYVGGREQDERTVEVHERQLEAMRERDLRALALVLDEHFRMLEESFARALDRDWEDLFGDVAAQTLRFGSPPAA
ncbi:MAG TPA: FCD domain-containing protein [Gaiellaceae bacterium]|nr:FCD domain-containing protein [Gaiellaceae bacterium]